MIITATHVFCLVFVSVIAWIWLELRSQKILKTLCGNLITVQVKNEDSTTKLINLLEGTTTTNSGIAKLLELFLKDEDERNKLWANQSEMRSHLQKFEDAMSQHAVVTAASVEKPNEEIKKLIERIETIEKKPASSSIAEQIQNLSVDQLLELGKNSGPVIEKLTKVMDFYNQFRTKK